MSDFKAKCIDFKAKCINFAFRWGSALHPRWGATALPQTPWLYLKGLLLRGGREEKGGRQRGIKVRGGILPTQKFWRGDHYDVGHIVCSFAARMR